MERRSKGRGRPMPDAGNIKQAAQQLEKALILEKNWISLQFDRKEWEVTLPARDGAVHVLRFLKVWFDAPQCVFFSSVSYLDQFLARMKVQVKHLSCLAVSCFNIAAESHNFNVNPSQLVGLSQSKCTVKDMQRMSTIVTKKLNEFNLMQHRTTLDLLKIYLDIFRSIAVQFKTEVLLDRMLQFDQLSIKLETLMCESSCAQFRPSILTLAFIQHEMEAFLAKEVPNKSNYYSMEMFYLLAIMIELQSLCKINSTDYNKCLKNIDNVLEEYERQQKGKYHQNLSWRFSTSTISNSRLSHYYSPMLNTVMEE